MYRKTFGVCISSGILFDNCIFRDQTFNNVIPGENGILPDLFFNLQKIGINGLIVHEQTPAFHRKLTYTKIGVSYNAFPLAACRKLPAHTNNTLFLTRFPCTGSVTFL